MDAHQAVLTLVSDSEVGWLSYIASDVMYALVYAYAEMDRTHSVTQHNRVV